MHWLMYSAVPIAANLIYFCFWSLVFFPTAFCLLAVANAVKTFVFFLVGVVWLSPGTMKLPIVSCPCCLSLSLGCIPSVPVLFPFHSNIVCHSAICLFFFFISKFETNKRLSYNNAFLVFLCILPKHLASLKNSKFQQNLQACHIDPLPFSSIAFLTRLIVYFVLSFPINYSFLFYFDFILAF